MKIKKKDLRRILAWFVTVLSLLLVFGFALVYYKTSLFSITSFSLEGVRDEDKAILLPLLTSHASARHLLVLRNDSILTPNERGIMRLCLGVLPNTKRISIQPAGLHTLRISFTEYEPAFHLEGGNLLDPTGVVFTSAQTYTHLPTLQLASFSTTTKKEYGIPVTRITSFDTSLLEYLHDFSEKISAVVFPVGTISLDEYGDVSFFDVDGVGVVKLTKSNLTKKTWTTFISAIDTEPLKSKLEKEKELLDYIDVRFGNKVFYSFGTKTSASSTDILPHYEDISTTTTEQIH